ncbi:hypothetical protein INR49_019862 [Caranx melampygus]|nr:hypothetical protein INR49_019862 [Caranx melampygus]
MDSAFERHCSELVARERSGHTAVVEGNLLYVWGGYMSVADDEVFLPNDEIWAYDLQEGVWQVFHMAGEVPPPMSGTCGCSLNGHMYIFGGCDDNGQTNQIYCVNLTDGKYTWKKIMQKTGSAPSPRDKLSCWIYKGRWRMSSGDGTTKFIYLTQCKTVGMNHKPMAVLLPHGQHMPVPHLAPEDMSVEAELWNPGQVTFTVWTLNHGRGQK